MASPAEARPTLPKPTSWQTPRSRYPWYFRLGWFRLGGSQGFAPRHDNIFGYYAAAGGGLRLEWEFQ